MKITKENLIKDFDFKIEEYDNKGNEKETIISMLINGILFELTNTDADRKSLFENFYVKYNEINDKNVVKYLAENEADINLIQKYQKLRCCYDIDKEMFHKSLFLRFKKSEDYSDMANEVKKIHSILVDMIALYSYMLKYNVESTRTEKVIKDTTNLLFTSFDHAMGTLKEEERDLTKAGKELEKMTAKEAFEQLTGEYAFFFEDCIRFIYKCDMSFDENNIDDFNKKYQETIKNSENILRTEGILREYGFDSIKKFITDNYVHNLLNANIKKEQ